MKIDSIPSIITYNPPQMDQEILRTLNKRGYSPQVANFDEEVSISFPTKSVFIVVDSEDQSIVVSKVHVNLEDNHIHNEEYPCTTAQDAVDRAQQLL
jgi:hypothetical protein